MKILTVTHAFPPEGTGGTERYAETVSRALRARGHELEVFTGSLEWREQFEVERLEHEGLPVCRVHRSDLYFDHWDKVGNPHVATVFEAELDRVQPDLIHLHHWIRLTDDLVRRAAARGVPAVVHLHDLFTTCPRVFRIQGEEQVCEEPFGPVACIPCVPRWSFQKDREIEASLHEYGRRIAAEVAAAAIVIAPSAAHRETLQRFQEHGVKIEVLRHPPLAAPWPRGQNADSPAGRLRVLFFSQLMPLKGAHVLLEAVRELGPESGVEVDLYGAFATPAYEERLRDLAQGQAVRFHGAYEPGDPAACTSDVVVIPALARESYSFGMDEAYQLGHPILASRIGALVERATGRVELFPPGDVSDLSQRLRRWRDHPASRRERAAAAGAEPLALSEHLAGLEGLFQQALTTGAQAPTRPLSDPSELLHDWDRRELYFRELLRAENWEQIQADLRRQLEELRSKDSASDP